MNERPDEGGPYDMPEAIHRGLKRYRDTGCPTGGFLQAVLENNLMKAFAAADPQSTASMKDIVRWCYWNLPADAWGSAKQYKDWVEKHRASQEQEPPTSG